MDPWNVELIVVRNGSLGVTERRSISRDVERGLLIRLRQGVYVLVADWDAGDGWRRERARHVLRARAFAAVAAERPVFSNWTAGVIQWLPMCDERLGTVHAFHLQRQEVVEVGGLLVTTRARTVVDIAGAARFRAGVVTADGALTAGLPRALLEQAVDLAGPRRAGGRIHDVVSFAHPGAESAAESDGRVSFFELGIEPQELQHEVRDANGLAGVLDTFDRRRRIGTEIDGLAKYLDPKLAPQGAGRAVVKEKWREDRVRAEIRGLARFGAGDARQPARLRPILDRVGLRPAEHRPTLADWAAEARSAVPRTRP